MDAEVKKNFCKMIKILQKVLVLLEAEPSPEVLKEQILHLINTILVCCKDYKDLK